LLENLKTSFYQKHLQKKLAEKPTEQKESVSFTSAQTIGILFDATNITNYGIVRKFEQEYKKKNKSVKLLGFINSKSPNGALHFPFFSKKDLNWYYKPDAPIIKEFLDKKFDILINAYMEETKPLLYISTFSNASLRIGLYFPEYTDALDMMITIKNEQTLENFFMEINQYLNIFT